jgi:cytoskeleton protein RodZ
VSQPATSASSGERKIVFKVEQESWIDVRDATGERLIYRTVNRGEDIQLQGQPPYSVFIGSAEGVSVQYQGREVPFKVHESGLFARFEVGGQ